MTQQWGSYRESGVPSIQCSILSQGTFTWIQLEHCMLEHVVCKGQTSMLNVSKAWALPGCTLVTSCHLGCSWFTVPARETGHQLYYRWQLTKPHAKWAPQDLSAFVWLSGVHCHLLGRSTETFKRPFILFRMDKPCQLRLLFSNSLLRVRMYQPFGLKLGPLIGPFFQ